MRRPEGRPQGRRRQGGKTAVANARIQPDGTYRVALPPGTYVVNIARTGVDRARGFPRTVTVATGQTARLDIDVDTRMW